MKTNVRNVLNGASNIGSIGAGSFTVVKGIATVMSGNIPKGVVTIGGGTMAVAAGLAAGIANICGRNEG